MVWNNSEPPRPETVFYNETLAVSWDNIQFSRCGLVNISNTCFLNSSLQALFHIPAFVDFIIQDGKHKTSCFSPSTCIACSLGRTLMSMNLHDLFRPIGIILLVQKICSTMERGKQQDAHEFLVCLHDKLEEELLKRLEVPLTTVDYCSRQTTAMGQIFGGWSETIDTCQKCFQKKSFFNPLTHLFLSAEEGSIQKSVSHYLSESETIEDYKCPDKCGVTSCVRKTSLHAYPKVLKIVLRRFGDLKMGQRINGQVEVNPKLTIGSLNYSLLSVILHLGSSMESGHYTCLTVAPDGSVVYFDDSKVSMATSDLLKTPLVLNGVYILFYQLDDVKMTSSKRPLPETPTRSSPLKKEAKIISRVSPFHRRISMGMKHLSPKRSVKHLSKTFLQITTLSTEDDVLAMPLSGMEKKLVESPFKLAKRFPRKPLANITGTPPIEDSIDEFRQPMDSDKESSTTETAVVTPVKLLKKVRLDGLQLSSYTRVNRTNLIHTRIETPSMHETVNDNESESDVTVNAIVSPINIRRSKKAEPKSSESQSSNDYTIIVRKCLGNSNANALGSSPDQVQKIGGKDIHRPVVVPIELINDDSYSIPLGNTLPQDQPNEMHGEHIPNQLQPAAFTAVVLTPEDVPGAILPHKEIARNCVKDLKRWLKCRGIPHNGNKAELVTRVQACFDMKEDHIIDPKIDGGKWYNIKMMKMREKLLSSQDLPLPLNSAFFPAKGWDAFPSREIPNNFNFGSIYHYLVETMPQPKDLLPTGNISDDEDEIANEEIIVEISDPFLDPNNNDALSSKKIRRGLQYVKSGCVRSMQDCLQDRQHFFKAHVRASMREKAYWVTVALSQLSGCVIRCMCDNSCPQRSLGRCSHVGAVLLFILSHKNLNGCGAITCTSRPCSWNRGSLKHKPTSVARRQYDSFKIDMKRRSTFDPRPMKFQTGFPSTQQKNEFLAALTYKEKPCHFQRILSLVYEDFSYSDEDLQCFRQNRSLFYDALRQLLVELKPQPQHQGAFQVTGTEKQSQTNLWFILRSLHATASPCKSICHFKTPNAVMNFLRRHLWGMNTCQTKAMAYGLKHEEEARQAYVSLKQLKDKSIHVKMVGLMLHAEHIGLSCSPDGIVVSTRHSDKLLEIKIPYMLHKNDPNFFDQVLSKTQLSRFCLTRDTNGKITIKDNHDYYYQVQMMMGMLDLKECDFFVWTEKGSVCVPVLFDFERWITIRERLKKFHFEYLVPEYFSMRTTRKLHPIQLKSK